MLRQGEEICGQCGMLSHVHTSLLRRRSPHRRATAARDGVGSWQLANNNIGTCQRVSEFMNRFLQVASSRWRGYAEILEATACKCLVPVEPVASSRWQRDAQRLEDGACRCGVQVASSRWQRDAWRLKGNACKCWMAVASRTWQRDAQK